MELHQIDIVTLAKSLRCSICFDIFTDPVTSPCGKHNYCLKCLKVRSCPACREEFHKDYKPQRNIILCDIVNVASRKTWDDILACSEYEDLPSSVRNLEVAERSDHNLQTVKRKLTRLTSEIKTLEDIISKNCKTEQQSKDSAAAANEFVNPGTFENFTERKIAPQHVPSKIPERPLDSMTNNLRLGLECLTYALCQLEQLDVPSQDLGASLQGNQLPVELSTVAWQQQDVERTPKNPITPLQFEGGPSDLPSEAQAVSMELGTRAEEAGPSAGLNDCLEHLFFSPQLAHKDLTFSNGNRRVGVQRRSRGRSLPSQCDHFNVSQVMAEQVFSSGVHYWEVDTSWSVGWAIGVAKENLGRDEKLGRTASSWCLEWSSNKLCFWHNNMSEHIKHGCPSKVRIMLDIEGHSLAFYSTMDNMILLHNVEVQFSSPVRPAFWLYGLTSGNSLALIIPEV